METECYLQEEPPAWCCVSLITSRVLLWAIASVNLVFGVAMIALGLVSKRVLEMIEIKDPQVVYILQGILVGQGVGIVIASIVSHTFIRTANIGKLYVMAGVVSFVLLMQVGIFLLARYFMRVLMNFAQAGISNCEVCKAHGDADVILTHVRPAIIVSGLGCISTAFQLSVVLGIKKHFLKMLHRERRRRMNRAFQLTPSFLQTIAASGNQEAKPFVPILQPLLPSGGGDSDGFSHIETKFTSTPIALPPVAAHLECPGSSKSSAPTICLYYEDELRKGPSKTGTSSMLGVRPAWGSTVCSPSPGVQSGTKKPRQSGTRARYLSTGRSHLIVPGMTTKSRSHSRSSLRYGNTLHPKSSQEAYTCKGMKWRGVSASSYLSTPTGSKGSVSSMLVKQAQVKQVMQVQIPKRSSSVAKLSGKVLRPPSYTAYPPDKKGVIRRAKSCTQSMHPHMTIRAKSCSQAVYYPFAHVAPIQRIHSSTSQRMNGIFKYCPPSARD